MTMHDWVLLGLPVGAGVIAMLTVKLGSWLSPSRIGRDNQAAREVVEETANQIGRGVVTVIRHDRERYAEQMNAMSRAIFSLQDSVTDLANRKPAERPRERA